MLQTFSKKDAASADRTHILTGQTGPGRSSSASGDPMRRFSVGLRAAGSQNRDGELRRAADPWWNPP
jgi:hypothetical protein